MKRYLILVSLIALALAAVGCASTGGLPEFGAEIGMQSSPVGDVRIPYTSLVSYYGYVKPGSEPDAVVDGKKLYYLYLWVPLVAPEIGIRMVSPVPEGMKPAENDFKAANWEEGEADASSYFDTWVSFERAVEVLSPEDIATKGPTASWFKYDSNDDSSELPANPSGSKYNSVLRVVSGDKPIVLGLYRIGFTTYKRGEVQGTFLAQVGAPIELPGTKIAKTIEDLAAAVTAPAM